MTYIPYESLGITAAVMAAALAFLVLTWNAVKAIHDWRALAAKPTDDAIADHELRIKRLEDCCTEVRGKLQSDWQWQQDAAEMNKLMLRSIKGLMQHAVDGNDVSKLEAMEQEIDNFLLTRAR